MPAHSAVNLRIERVCFANPKEATRHSEPTVDSVTNALAQCEVGTKRRYAGCSA
jgi:hypothetical protein